jgi:hypothetical protein
MATATFAWKNTDGSVVQIDLAKLPVTSQPANVIMPNVHIGDGTDGTALGQLYRADTPLLWFAPDGLLHRSTTQPLADVTTNYIYKP